MASPTLPLKQTLSKPTEEPPTPTKAPLSSREKKLASLNAHTITLTTTLSLLTSERQTLLSTLSSTSQPKTIIPDSEDEPESPDEETITTAAKATIKRHIGLLHAYNEIKDVGQGLMGLLAESRGVRIREVQEGFGMGEG
ncbi:hypothetical protein M501DRAFT_1000820, partial [Patellaria atrata CBS 101060]